ALTTIPRAPCREPPAIRFHPAPPATSAWKLDPRDELLHTRRMPAANTETGFPPSAPVSDCARPPTHRNTETQKRRATTRCSRQTNLLRTQLVPAAAAPSAQWPQPRADPSTRVAR